MGVGRCGVYVGVWADVGECGNMYVWADVGRWEVR